MTVISRRVSLLLPLTVQFSNVWLMNSIDKCNDAQKSAQVKDFNSAVASTNIGPDPDFPDFDLICEG